jgi:hypothetical protein
VTGAPVNIVVRDVETALLDLEQRGLVARLEDAS